MPLNIDIPPWNSKIILGIIYVTHNIFDPALHLQMKGASYEAPGDALSALTGGFHLFFDFHLRIPFTLSPAPLTQFLLRSQ